ncbi:MAG: 2-oxoglutarate dehydrogenase complex dihydrolipoyllysine-residue succinyltransferase [Myxococcales bacterium]|nr:2-oxoglutarate dehydrogenase complex dihydrolipoyllysine-residue succinyltransferase [Myxococcota bacterium]MDW8283461.1 2-oxoglutarate dehydrogenase complex dihydrolipoyllysine-residue succinyltransferase [Myxococcales bacterium]
MSIELLVPALGESISEAVIAKWLKQVGEAVAADEPVAQLETDKITVDLPAPQAGVLRVQRHPVGATVRVGESIGTLDTDAAAAPAPRNQPESSAPPARAEQQPPAEEPVRPQASRGPIDAVPRAGAPHLSPTMRRLLREQGVDPATWKEPLRPTPAPLGLQPAPPPRGPEEVVPMSPLRRRIAERLVQAQQSAAILTTFNEVDLTAVQALRSRHQEEFQQRHGVKLGLMSFFVKATIDALRAFPGLNAEVRGHDIVYKKYYDLGIAVGGGKGLVVPVLRGADALSFAEIERGIAALAQKARDNQLTLEDLAGGTFTITNGGIYGSMMSTPLLNPPQTGILGMHAIMRRPVAVGEAIEIRPMMYLALSYDHRVVDGREAVQFLVHIKQRLEQPDKLLLGI